MAKPGGRASSAPLVGKDGEPTVFELSVPGRRAGRIRKQDIPEASLDELEGVVRRSPLGLPEVAERDLVAHFTRLASRNYSVDLGAYPLGSCTMKYNPKLADQVAAIEGLARAHPDSPPKIVQGWMALMFELEDWLREITGMRAVTLQPPAGAAGELTGLLIIKAYHQSTGRAPSKVIIPDSAHGTNPASVTLAGYKAVTVPSGPDGLVSLEDLRTLIDDDVAAIMLTNPNTLGLFESEIKEILELVHSAGALAYYDGANLNAIVGVARPGDMGFDVVHINLHKTFATPHGGGGPGAGPVAVTERLVDFLPGPLPRPDEDGSYYWLYPKNSIGRVHSYYGNSLVLARALAFMKYLGSEGLGLMSRLAVLNANWLRNKIKDAYELPFSNDAMHEFVVSARALRKASGVKALDIAKSLIDSGFHAPTVYFPLVVEEALMIEPTETESPQTLEALAEVLVELAETAAKDPERLKEAPLHTPVKRLDEARAARQPVLTEDGFA